VQRLSDAYEEKKLATIKGERDCAHCGQYLAFGSAVIEAGSFRHCSVRCVEQRSPLNSTLHAVSERKATRPSSSGIHYVA
jgi:hypothetical protein